MSVTTLSTINDIPKRLKHNGKYYNLFNVSMNHNNAKEIIKSNVGKIGDVGKMYNILKVFSVYGRNFYAVYWRFQYKK